MGLKDHYSGLLAKSADIQEELWADEEAVASFNRAHNAAVDLERVISAVEDRPEAELMHLASRELQFALLSASLSHYRHAFISTRLAMEMMIGSIYFSAYEIKLRNWMRGAQDIVWSSLIDDESGPFSKSFISAFSPDFADSGRQFHTLAAKVYRECSEYAHGNVSTHADAGDPLSYNRDKLIAWAERLSAAQSAILFVFIARYADYLDSEKVEMIEPVLLDSLGDNVAVQRLLSKVE